MKNDHDTRKCRKCGKWFPLSTFPRYSSGEGRRHECHGCYRARMLVHYKKDRRRRLDKAKARYAADPSAHWTPERRTRANELARQRNAILRDQVIGQYGNRCVCCGETGKLFLTLDHVENNGSQMRKGDHGVTSSGLYRWAIKNGYPKSLQVLCMNCNFGKARNGGICPHQEGSTTIPKGSTAKRPEVHHTPRG